MNFYKPYKQLNRLVQNESFEPTFSWGLRMAVSGTIPIVWGLATGHLNAAIWMVLSAEAISWIEMKGSFQLRYGILVIGLLSSNVFALLGTITGPYLWLSLICMFGVGFLATILKNIGDRTSGLAISVYMLFIICNAFPVGNFEELKSRMALINYGAIWAIVVGLIASIITPAEEPYRREIALIWRSIADLTETISKLAATNARVGKDINLPVLEEIYKRENEVRNAIDNSYEYNSRMAHQVSQKDNKKYQLSLVRKAAGLVAVNVIAIAEEIDKLYIPGLDASLRVRAGTLLGAMREAISRMSVYIISLDSEEKLLAISHINRMKKLSALLLQMPMPKGHNQGEAHKRIMHLIGRNIKLMESAITRLEQMGHDKPIYKSYSLIKTAFLMNPMSIWRNIRLIFSFNTLTTHYALRSAIAATLALFLSKWFHIDHGYWMPFSVMIVIQPYFGATYKKALDRVIGTVLGGLAGSLLMQLPAGLHFKEVFLFLSFTIMIYFVKKKYAIATFIITLNLVLLFDLESSYSNSIMIWRAVCTIGGAGLAVLSGWALFPTWDKEWLPIHIAGAIKSNYEYFLATFFVDKRNVNWTRNKRDVETKNSNVFDSYNRYMEEPGKVKSSWYYELITSNVRITRNLNNIHMDQDEKQDTHDKPTKGQQARINECLLLFNQLADQLHMLDSDMDLKKIETDKHTHSPFYLNGPQIASLEKIIIELKTMAEEIGHEQVD